ncbi:MAG: hypothetical protein ACMG6E_00290 [Candidatus Roizmanbacteria bacterium]
MIFSILFFLLFKTPLFISQDILFYRGIDILFVLAVMSLIWIAYLFYKRDIYVQSYIAALCISASLWFSFFVLVPVTVDRSISTYLLETLVQSRSCISHDGLEDKFIKEYVKDHDAIKKRISEQVATGTITLSSKSCIQITPKGIRLEAFFRFFKNYFRK